MSEIQKATARPRPLDPSDLDRGYEDPEPVKSSTDDKSKQGTGGGFKRTPKPRGGGKSQSPLAGILANGEPGP